MKKFGATSAIVAALAVPTNIAAAADYDRQLGLIVSGVVESWNGVQFIDNDGASSDDTVLASGHALRLSLPLGDNLSIQMDADFEWNDKAFDNDSGADPFGPRYSVQGATHLSWRDPASYLLGVFGGAGGNSAVELDGPGSSVFDKYDYGFVGGEAQIYLSNITFYAQAAYLHVGGSDEFGAGDGQIDDGFYGRGVIRWFIDHDTRLQFEGLYGEINYFGDVPSYDVAQWGVRFDTTIDAVPVVGDLPVFVGYRGVLRDGCNDDGTADQTDHTIMVGTSITFSGSMLDVDRRGATLDAPNIGNYLTCFNGVGFVP